MAIRQFKAGDTPVLTAQLAQETSVDEDGEPGYEGIELDEVELEDAAVLVYIRHEASGSIVAAGDEADVVDVKEGYVEYAMDATQTAAPGEYTVEFVATWPDSHADKPGHKHTWPTEGYETIEATESINRDASLDVVEVDVEFDHVDANSASIGAISDVESTINSLETTTTDHDTTIGSLQTRTSSLSDDGTSANLDSLSTGVGGISSTQVSGRAGGFVYYDPENPGPYADGQAALADVPEGGTLLLAPVDYVVADEGPLVSDRPVHIRGSGYGQDDSGTPHGTVLRSDYADGPVIDFSGFTDSNGNQERPERASIRDLAIWQTSETTHPLVRFENTIHTDISDCLITALGNADRCVQYQGESFFARQYRNKISGWRERGVSVEGTGFAHEFHQNFITSAQGPDHTALYVNTERPVITGGQYSAPGTGGCAIHLDANDSVKTAGGLVIEPGIERTEYPLRVGGAFTREATHAQFFAGHLGSDVVSVLDLVNSNGGDYKPTFSTSTSGQLVNYGTDSLGNTITLSGSHLEGMTIGGSPSNRELIRVTTSVDNGQLPSFPTGGVRIYCDMNVTENTPVWHNLGSWHTASSTTFTP